MIDVLITNRQSYAKACMKKSKSHYRTEEALQNAAIRCLTSNHPKVINSNTYVKTIVLNELANTFTRKQMKEVVDNEMYNNLMVSVPAMEHTTEEEDQLIIAMEVINSMSPARKSIMLVVLEGSRLADIPGSRNTTKAHYFQGIKLLKEVLCKVE